MRLIKKSNHRFLPITKKNMKTTEEKLNLFLHSEALRGETLNYRSGSVTILRDFCGWYFVIRCFAAFCATRLVKCKRMNI